MGHATEKPVQGGPAPAEHLLLFDGVCNLCNGLVQCIARRDRCNRFRFIPLQSDEGMRLLAAHGQDPGSAPTLVYLRKGHLHARSEAVLYVARDLGGGWQLAFACMAVPRTLRDALYNWVARNRYHWFGKRNECMLPGPGLRERFL